MIRALVRLAAFAFLLWWVPAMAQDDEPPPPAEEPPPPDDGPGDSDSGPSEPPSASSRAAPPAANNTPAEGGKAEDVPEGQELVNIDFPEPTDINDIIRAVARWTGKNVILGKGVSGKVQMISPTKVTKEEAYQMFLSALNVNKLTTVETGKVIKIMQTRSAIKDNLQIYQGSQWAPQTDKMITQIVPLRYIDAKDLQTTLSRIVTTNSMIAYTPTNTLIISDTGYKVRRILAIVELLDVQGQQPQVALVPIRYADAKVIAQKVSEILQAQAKKSGAQQYKVSVDERSNSVVIFGPPRTISDVKNLVKKFDFPVDDPANQAAIRVRFLNYADAKKLATTLSSLAGGQGNRTSSAQARVSRLIPPDPKANGGQPPGANSPVRDNVFEAAPVASLGDNVKITADDSSNSLIITGSRSAYESINGLVRKLDQRRAQVYVEVDIIDVNLTDEFRFGTSIFTGSARDGSKVSYGWQAGSGIGPVIAAQQATPKDGPIPPDIAKGAVNSLGKDFTIGVLSGQPVDVPGLGKISPGGLITMIKNDVNSRILSSPHLLTSNNEQAKIVVGQKLFYPSATETPLGTASAIPKMEKEDVSLTLEIKPNISHTGNYITMKIDLMSDDGTVVGGIPNISKRQTSQIVTLKSGQTAVISGLIKNNESEIFNKIPLLGDIPILGWLFRNTSKSKVISNLMFFITPHIVYGANDLAKIYKDKLAENNDMMSKYFNDDGTSEWMMKSPQLAEGEYIPNPYDQIEEKQRLKYLNEMRRDMGFSQDELEQFQTPEDATKIPTENKTTAMPGATTTKASGSGAYGGSGLSFPADPHFEQPISVAPDFSLDMSSTTGGAPAEGAPPPPPMESAPPPPEPEPSPEP